VLIVDYKSDAAVPPSSKAVSPNYLRQLGLYRLAARRLFPQAAVDAAILWTQTSLLMKIEDGPLDAAVADVTAL
jgi:ATP-dependent helicase/nuclease subunit A